MRAPCTIVIEIIYTPGNISLVTFGLGVLGPQQQARNTTTQETEEEG